MTDRELLEQALEALENPWKAGPDGVANAITALRERLAQPERKPVAWLPSDPPPECTSEAEKTAFAFGWFKAMEAQRVAQPEQEPVVWMNPSWADPNTRGWPSDSFESIPIDGWIPLSPRREWQGLTLDQKKRLNDALNLQGRFPIIDAIEAALKEKNT